MKKRLTVIMNENHTLLPEQERILKEMFPDLEPEFLFAPATGWTKEEMDKIVASFKEVAIGPDCYHIQDVVFVSPIPYLLRELTRAEVAAYPESSINTGIWVDTGIWVSVFHNDRREKKELPDGRVIQVVAQEGWQLV